MLKPPFDKIKCLLDSTESQCRPVNDRDKKMMFNIGLLELNSLGQRDEKGNPAPKLMMWDRGIEDQSDKAVTNLCKSSPNASAFLSECYDHLVGMRLTTHLWVWLALECTEARYGICWVHALYEMWLKNDDYDQILALDKIGQYFPYGMPNEDRKKECYESQFLQGPESGDAGAIGAYHLVNFWDEMRRRKEEPFHVRNKKL